jgi:hypothetical protein
MFGVVGLRKNELYFQIFGGFFFTTVLTIDVLSLNTSSTLKVEVVFFSETPATRLTYTRSNIRKLINITMEINGKA